MSEIADSSVAPSDSVSKTSRRKRPGKKERASLSGFTPANSGTAVDNMHKRAEFASPKSQTGFSPGKYPVIFDTGVGAPTVDAFFGVRVGAFARHVDDIYGALSGETKFTQFRADASVIAPNAEVDLRRQFVAAGLCTLATQVVKCHDEMKLPVGDFGPIPVSDAYHLSSVHSVASQYGEFEQPEVGRRYNLYSYEGDVRRIMRYAGKVMSGVDANHLSDTAWLPTMAGDKSSFAILANSFHEVATSFGVPVPDAEVILSDLGSGQTPDWWNTVLYSRPDWAQFRRLFERLPNAVDWVNAFVAQPEPGETGLLQLLGLRWENPNVGDLDWSLNVKSMFGDIQTRWSIRRPSLDKFFRLEVAQSRNGMFRGSSLQLSSLHDVQNITLLRSAYAESTAAMSLSAVFSPAGYFSNRERLDVRVSSLLNVRQRGVEWVLRDFK